MKTEAKFVFRVAGTLTIISLVISALLGVVYEVTKENIETIKREKTETSLREIFPQAEDFKEIQVGEEVNDIASKYGAKIKAIYEVTGKTTSGYACLTVAGGSQGDIEMMVGVDAKGKVAGIAVIDHTETSGIGSKVMDNLPLSNGVGVLEQFQGKGSSKPLTVGKDIDAISGATVSTKGVTKGVNASVAVIQEQYDLLWE